MNGLRAGERAGGVRLHGGRGGEQAAGVGVLGIGEEGLGGVLFDDFSVLHDGYAIGDLRDYGEVVGDEQHGEVVGAADVFQKMEDLGLHGDVEGGSGLVGDQEPGAVDEGHGDEDALALAAGKLVRIVVDAALGIGQGDISHGL